jgi:hypothetical protein
MAATKCYASAAIIEAKETGEFLLQLRDFGAPKYAGWFTLLGGYLEEGERPHEAMWRELREETNLDEIASRDELQSTGMRGYVFPDDVERVFESVLRIYPKVPTLLLPSGRGKKELAGEISSLWGRKGDYSFAYRMKKATLEKVVLKDEGKIARLYAPSECMAMMIAPDAMLMLYDHFAETGVEVS